jgi:hypothetical protein
VRWEGDRRAVAKVEAPALKSYYVFVTVQSKSANSVLGARRKGSTDAEAPYTAAE